MKTKNKRENLSKKRQALAQTLAIWDQKVSECQFAIGAGISGAATKLSFALAEREKCNRALRKTYTRQRAWATHGYIPEKC